MYGVYICLKNRTWYILVDKNVQNFVLVILHTRMDIHTLNAEYACSVCIYRSLITFL